MSHQENAIKTVAKTISFISTVPGPKRIIIMNGVKGGTYVSPMVNVDPGLVIKYDAKTIGSTATRLIMPEDCCASCSEVKKVPIAAKMAA